MCDARPAADGSASAQTPAGGTLRVAGMVNDSITDGPGLRFALFLQGCERRCPGCHNPHTWDMAGGEDMTVDEVWGKIAGNPLLDGVTLTGGEPFAQAGALLPLARRIKAAGLGLAAYSGYTLDELVCGGGDGLLLLKWCDVLVDGPFVLAQRSLALSFRGSRNQRLVDVAASLAAGRVVELEEWTK